MVGDTAMTMYDFSFDLLVYYWLKGVAFSIEKVEQIILPDLYKQRCAQLLSLAATDGNIS